MKKVFFSLLVGLFFVRSPVGEVGASPLEFENENSRAIRSAPVIDENFKFPFNTTGSHYFIYDDVGASKPLVVMSYDFVEAPYDGYYIVPYNSSYPGRLYNKVMTSDFLGTRQHKLSFIETYKCDYSMSECTKGTSANRDFLGNEILSSNYTTENVLYSTLPVYDDEGRSTTSYKPKSFKLDLRNFKTLYELGVNLESLSSVYEEGDEVVVLNDYTYVLKVAEGVKFYLEKLTPGWSLRFNGTVSYSCIKNSTGEIVEEETVSNGIAQYGKSSVAITDWLKFSSVDIYSDSSFRYVIREAQEITFEKPQKAPVISNLRMTPENPTINDVVRFTYDVYYQDPDTTLEEVWSGEYVASGKYPLGANTVKLKVIDSNGLESNELSISFNVRMVEPTFTADKLIVKFGEEVDVLSGIKVSNGTATNISYEVSSSYDPQTPGIQTVEITATYYQGSEVKTKTFTRLVEVLEKEEVVEPEPEPTPPPSGGDNVDGPSNGGDVVKPPSNLEYEFDFSLMFEFASVLINKYAPILYVLLGISLGLTVMKMLKSAFF